MTVDAGGETTASAGDGGRAPADPPNVLVVHCHDLGRYLGCYGWDVRTPHLDELAAEGVCFENHFTTAPQCSPSRGSLWTGLHPHVNGLMGLEHSGRKLHEWVPTLPGLLADLGYRTHLFGLQHVTDDPRAFGYTDVHPQGDLASTLEAASHERNRAADVADTVTEFLRAGPEGPFFASVGFFEAHRVDVGDRHGFEAHRYDCPDPGAVEPLPYLPDRRGIREDLAAMAGMVRAVDDAFGRIDAALEAAGLADDTLVVFTTEHGIAFPRAKGSCFDPGIEAALLVRLPGTFDGGVRYDELVSNVDVLPTVLDLVGAGPPAAVAGRSLLPLVAGGPHEPREHVFAEITWHDRYDPVRAIRTERFKYIRSFWHRPPVYLPNDVLASRAGRAVHETCLSGTRSYRELYDLRADPHEQENLAGAAELADVVAELDDRLVAWMRATDDPLLDGPVPPANYDELVP